MKSRFWKPSGNHVFSSSIAPVLECVPVMSVLSFEENSEFSNVIWTKECFHHFMDQITNVLIEKMINRIIKMV